MLHSLASLAMKLLKATSKLVQIILGGTVVLTAPWSQAAGFRYEPKNLLLGIRQDGGTSELVVNLGPITNYLGSPTATITITNLSTNQLNAAFANLNNLKCSVFACVGSDEPIFPLNTLWVSRPRANRETQSTPWSRSLELLQGNSCSKMESIGRNAAIYGSQQPAGPDNTEVGVVIPTGDSLSYGVIIGSGNFGGSFPGNIEQTTPADFATAGNVVRSDFYEVRPGSGPATYLGYFEFRPDGKLSLVPAGSTPSVPRPTITGFARSGGTNFLSFDTIANATYSVLFTNTAGLGVALTNWPASPTIAGTGQAVTYSDSVAEADRFYVIRAE